jgi:hypothetical protein
VEDVVVGLREKLNDNPNIATGITIAVIVIVVGFIVYSTMGRGPSGGAPVLERAFFTIDDGTTWFIDDVNKVPPFDRDGKQAVRAHVYKCQGKTFVNHLERQAPEVQKRRQQTSNTGAAADAPSADAGAIEVKSPGDDRWVNANDPAAAKIIQPKCKDGNPELVLP